MPNTYIDGKPYGLGANAAKFAWVTYQTPLDQNPPVLNTLHTVFAATGGVKLYSVNIIQTNTPTNMEEIDVLYTIDSVESLYDASAIGGLNNNNAYSVYTDLEDTISYPNYRITIQDNVAAGFALNNLAHYGSNKGCPVYGHDIMVQVRQTSAIAAAARIRVKATYDVLELV